MPSSPKKIVKPIRYLEISLDFSRITVHSGDVSKNQLGLSKYGDLSVSVLHVFHNAARVNGMLPYAVLSQTNVVSSKHF